LLLKGHIVRNPTLPLGLSLLLLVSHLQSLQASAEKSRDQKQNVQDAKARAQPAATTASDTAKTLLPGQFILQEGTPVKLRLSRNVSSADAHEGDSVDFEVLEDVAASGIVVIPKGSVAIGSVTEAQPKRRMGRAGKLEMVLDYVRLADTEKAAIRAVKDAKGGSHVAGMTDITIPKGAEVTGYINGDMRLEASKFAAKPDAAASTSAQPSNDAAQSATPAPASTGSIAIQSTPDGAEVYADNAFIGNAPATLKLSAGQHTIRVSLAGYRDWSRDISVQGGSDAHLTATMQKPSVD
jgi:PEGA domain